MRRRAVLLRVAAVNTCAESIVISCKLAVLGYPYTNRLREPWQLDASANTTGGFADAD